MKNILLLLLISPIICLSQVDDSNFIVENGELKWQKVYETSKTIDELFISLKTKKELSSVEMIGNVILGDIVGVTVDRKAAGLKSGNTAVYTGMDVYGSLKIEFKDNRYRATIFNIRLAMPNYLEALGNRNDLESLSTYALKRGGITQRFIDREGVAYDYTFNRIVEDKDTSKDDNW